LIIDKNSLFKLASILTEKPISRQSFFVFSDLQKISGNCFKKICGSACLLRSQAVIFAKI